MSKVSNAIIFKAYLDTDGKSIWIVRISGLLAWDTGDGGRSAEISDI